MNDSHLLIKRHKLFIPRTVFSLQEKEKPTIAKVKSAKHRLSKHDSHESEVSSLFCYLPFCGAKQPLTLLTDRRDPALALATDSFSFSAARRWIPWKLLRAAEKSFISLSLWIFCCLWRPQSKGRQVVRDRLCWPQTIR